MQLEGANSNAIVVSTMAEAHAMINSELTKTNLLKDVKPKLSTSRKFKYAFN